MVLRYQYFCALICILIVFSNYGCINKSNDNDKFCAAIMANDIATVESFIDKGINVNTTEMFESPAFHYTNSVLAVLSNYVKEF